MHAVFTDTGKCLDTQLIVLACTLVQKQTKMKFIVVFFCSSFFILYTNVSGASLYSGDDGLANNYYGGQAQTTTTACPDSLTAAYSQNVASNKIETLSHLDFARDFEQWNPRSNFSQWRFAVSDNALFVVHENSNNNNNGYYGGYVDMKSLPFHNWVNNSSPSTTQTNTNEALVNIKAVPYALGKTQKLLVRMRLGCRTRNVNQHPFPANLVTDPEDDPR